MSAFYSTGPLPDLHADCETPWECLSCGRDVCPRCDPSPAEPSFCVECHHFGVGVKKETQ